MLGVSKSSLYRTYPGLIKQALWLAKRKAASGLESKKAAFGLESASKDGDLHAYSLLSRKVPHDLPVEHLYDAILKLSAAGKPIDERSIYLALRRQGVLAEGEKLFDYFDSTCVANVVRAVTDPQGPPAHQKTPRCAAA